MNETKKKALWFSLLGFALGVGIGVTFHMLAGPDAYLAQGENLLSLLLYFLLCGLYGAVNMGTSALYAIEKWSILRCTFTHFMICVGSAAVFFGLLILFGWMEVPPAGIIALAGAAVVIVYLLIWLAQYISYRRKVRKMNVALRQWRARQKK